MIMPHCILAWVTERDTVSEKKPKTNKQMSRARSHMPVIPATQEAEAGESLELGKWRLQ